MNKGSRSSFDFPCFFIDKTHAIGWHGSDTQYKSFVLNVYKLQTYSYVIV